MRTTPANVQMRRAYAELLRQFFSGQVTNWEYQDRFDDLEAALGGDDAVDDIYTASWFLFGDTREYRMTDPGVCNRSLRRMIARWVLFLHGDLDYHRVDERLLNNAWIRLMTMAASVVAVFVCLSLGQALIASLFTAVCLATYVSMWIRGCNFSPRLFNRAYCAQGADIWPFATVRDFVRARSNPRLLAGSNR